MDEVLPEAGRDGALGTLHVGGWRGEVRCEMPCVWMGDGRGAPHDHGVSPTHSRCSLYTCEWLVPGFPP